MQDLGGRANVLAPPNAIFLRLEHLLPLCKKYRLESRSSASGRRFSSLGRVATVCTNFLKEGRGKRIQFLELVLL